jgi:hypothetical protein
MATDRGAYRPLFVSLLNGPTFTAFGWQATAIFYPLKLMLPPFGIAAVPALAAVLAHHSKLPLAEVETGLDELKKAGWVEQEGNLVWLVRGFECEPAFSALNPKHRHYLADLIAKLPHLPIVDRFRAHYSNWFPDMELTLLPDLPPVEGLSHTLSHTLSHSLPDRVSGTLSDTQETGNRKQEKAKASRAKKARGKRAASGGSNGRVPPPTWLTPYMATWAERFGGTAPAGPLAKAVKPLHDTHGEAVTLLAWRAFLAEQDVRYVGPSTPQKFASTFGVWSGDAPRAIDPTLTEEPGEEAYRGRQR